MHCQPLWQSGMGRTARSNQCTASLSSLTTTFACEFFPGVSLSATILKCSALPRLRAAGARDGSRESACRKLALLRHIRRNIVSATRECSRFVKGLSDRRASRAAQLSASERAQ